MLQMLTQYAHQSVEMDTESPQKSVMMITLTAPQDVMVIVQQSSMDGTAPEEMRQKKTRAL